MKKYKIIRIPLGIDRRVSSIKTSMELDLFKYTGKKVKIPKIKVWEMVFGQTFYMHPSELKNKFLGSRKRRMLTL